MGAAEGDAANSAAELLNEIGERLDELRAELTPDQLRMLLAAVTALTAAGEDPREVRRALMRVRQALIPLPFDSPLRELAVEQMRSSPAAVVAVPDRAEALLRQLTDLEANLAAERVLAAARRRLLNAPSRSGAELDPGPAADPLGAGLIRLSDPERGARYPDFQFPVGAGSPHRVVAEVNRLLLADRDPWGAADWWLGGNRWLAGTPAELIGSIPDERLTAAARALVEGED
ncbi:hypothetical protein RM780_18940 [Streptomyces sp. DSM 44917]|uniref:Uncharacterized protein n=1 Tax=Streptomyces boetiae TaxID=3075541 RepID=A0ABU2LBR3_9ACTN|nr:hypothetical protein [Streptomyces sp. DSM 44917]MDT0309020.1 hypothetical protein [Streptomyces sp. DSM 44917]